MLFHSALKRKFHLIERSISLVIKPFDIKSNPPPKYFNECIKDDNMSRNERGNFVCIKNMYV